MDSGVSEFVRRYLIDPGVDINVDAMLKLDRDNVVAEDTALLS